MANDTSKQIAAVLSAATWREVDELSRQWADIFTALEHGAEMAEVQLSLVEWAEAHKETQDE